MKTWHITSLDVPTGRTDEPAAVVRLASNDVSAHVTLMRGRPSDGLLAPHLGARTVFLASRASVAWLACLDSAARVLEAMTDAPYQPFDVGELLLSRQASTPDRTLCAGGQLCLSGADTWAALAAAFGADFARLAAELVLDPAKAKREAQIRRLRSERSHLKHGPGGSGQRGPCDPNCRKCAIDRQLEEIQRDDGAASRDVNDVPPPLTPEQGAVLARCFRIGFGELQARVVRGDEDDRLAEMIDTFDAYFAVCRAKLGHDRVPVGTWETYTAIRRRNALVKGGSHG